MRSGLILALVTAALLAACQTAGPGAGGAEGLAVDEIAVTSLDTPAPEAVPEAPVPEADLPEAPAPEAEAAPEADAAPEAEAPPEPEVSIDPVAPEAPKSAPQILCEKGGGIWTVAGETGAFLCVSPTRDGGESCRKKTDCEGQCLARSGTCSPYDPLFGCNEVLDKDGRRMTLCLD